MSFNRSSLIVMQHIQFDIWGSRYVHCYLLFVTAVSFIKKSSEDRKADFGWWGKNRR